VSNVSVKITCKDGRDLYVKGKPFDVSGHRFVAHKSIRGNVRHNGWSVTCAETGLSLGVGWDTQKAAIDGSYVIATRIDNRQGPGAFDSQMRMIKDGAK
jgi:hypothetical protein